MQINKKISLNPSTKEIESSKILINPSPKLISSFTGTIIYTNHLDKAKLNIHTECNLILPGDEDSIHKALRNKKKYFEIDEMSFCMIPGFNNHTMIIKELDEKTIIIKDEESKLPFAITEDMIIKYY